MSPADPAPSEAPDAGTRSVVVERELPFPPDRVWRALTTPELFAEWVLMRAEGFRAVPGQRFRLEGEWGGVDCDVRRVEPPETLSYGWVHVHEDPAYALDSEVTFTLTPTSRGTRLRMEQAGFRTAQRQALMGATAGWRQHLERLEQAIARAA